MLTVELLIPNFLIHPLKFLGGMVLALVVAVTTSQFDFRQEHHKVDCDDGMLVIFFRVEIFL